MVFSSMAALNETLEQHDPLPPGSVARQPGVVVVLDAGKPAARAFALPRAGLELGRGAPEGVFDADERVSRRHLSVHHTRGTWTVTDLGSRNGTYIDAEKIQGFVDCTRPVLIRVGQSLLWTVDDVTLYQGASEPLAQGDAPVVGGRLRRLWDEIAVASRAGDTLLVRGESGTGKELAARRFHAVSFAERTAPFIAVNCAAIPEGLAERLLFGAKRGAYSGAATDAEGYVAAAHQGTLFLDEVAELDPLVQAKLLRVLESREVLPLGESKPRPVQIRVCAATHANLRDEVAAGRFRQDLYFRLGRPEVVLPPLRERIDELPWLIAAEIRRAHPGREPSVGLIEACALRPWPGNVRELLREVRLAAHAKLERGATLILAEHLAPDAGREIAPASVPRAAAAPSDDAIAAALGEHDGNVTRAAKALGLHRNQLRRWLAKRGGSEG
jgi:DNA-binding NtrC family response regulator